MDVFEALYTTRAMRRVTDQPIPDDVQARILDAAIRAPRAATPRTGASCSSTTRPSAAELGPIYRDCIAMLWQTIYKDRLAAADADAGRSREPQILRVQRCASTWPTTSRSTRCCCSASSSTTRPAARSIPRSGARCSPPAARASAPRSPRCCCSSTTMCSRCSACPRTRAGSSWCVDVRLPDGPLGRGAAHTRPRRWPTATDGHAGRPRHRRAPLAAERCGLTDG